MARRLTHVFNNGNRQTIPIPQRGDALLALLAQFTDTDLKVITITAHLRRINAGSPQCKRRLW